MTETVSNVYDLTYPSPITLKDISSIVVAVELWRKEISAQLESKRLPDELNLKNNIRPRSILPNLPSTIYTLLEKYVDTFRKSVVRWHKYHHDHVFNDSGSMNILSRFDDFAWDWDGTIHEVRTAKRMILCDRLTEDEKFEIACLYCFEDDIKQIWPSVSETKTLNEFEFFHYPLQHYWIYYLRNELHMIPILDNLPIDEFMIYYSCGYGNRSSVMYFWKRLPSDVQSQIDLFIKIHALELFARFILPKLNKQQLETFVAQGSARLMEFLFTSESRLIHVLPVWMFIRSRIDIESFKSIITRPIIREAYFDEHIHSRGVENSFRGIWESAPQHFKRSMMDFVLHFNHICRVWNCTEWKYTRGMKCLITVLRDASFEERNAFWNKNWPHMICKAPIEDLVVTMKLSFRNESEITSFKENIMSKYENITEGCAYLLKHGMFKGLNDFLSVCCLDEHKRTDLKQRLLTSNYVGENSVFTRDVVRNNKLLNEFIDDAFQDAADLGVEFRTQLASSPVTETGLLDCIRSVDFVHLMEFVDTFFANEQAVVSVKKRLSERFKEHLIDGSILLKGSDDTQEFLIWLLSSENEVIRFKKSIPVEEVFRTMMQVERRRVAEHVDDDDFKSEFPQKVDHFLMWYFNKDKEEIEKFMKPFLNEFVDLSRLHLENVEESGS